MITLGAPQFLWALAIPAGIIAVYLLRRRYQPRQVPSTFLWRRTLKDHEANRPMQRLRKNLLLAVQLLAAVLLVLALAQPNIQGSQASHTILIFDLSGSMQAETEEGRTRLDRAKDEARRMLGELPPGEKVTVLTAGESVRQLLTGSTDTERVRRAVDGLACEKGGADLAGAVALAEAVRREDPEEGARIVVFSDDYQANGKTASVNAENGAENRSVYALTAENGQAYARIGNFGGDCVLTVSCRADGRLCEAKEIEIPAGETAGVLFSIPQDARRTEVTIREKDAIAADNRAEAVVKQRRERTVALTEDSLFLESALKVRGDIRVLRTGGEAPETAAADLYVLGGEVLRFTRNPGETAFTWDGAKEPEGSLAAEADSPLAKGLTMNNVYLRTCTPVHGGKAALRAGGEAVAAYAEDEVVIGFDLHETNLPLKYDFPILIQNILNYLLPETAPEEAEAEQPMPVSESDVRRVAPSAEAAEGAGDRRGSRSLTEWLLAGFLALLLAEFLLAREPWVRRKQRKGAGK